MKKLLSGDEAVARGAYEFGVKFAAGYPGTPSTEILENISQYKEIDSQWSPNEKVAFDVAMGVSLGGERALVALKHVGLNVASDPFMVFPYADTNGGFVVVSCDDPGMHSSQNEQDNRYYAKFAKVPLLEPSDSQEAKDFVGIAFEISESVKVPVLMRLTTRTSHTKGLVEFADRFERESFNYERNIPKQVVPVYARFLRPEVEKRLAKLTEFSESFEGNRLEEGDGDVGVITSGISYQYAREILPEAPFLKLGMSYPLPREKIIDFCSGFEKVIVVEENEPFLEEQIKSFGVTNVIGKEKIPLIGELNPEVVENAIHDTPLLKGYSDEIAILPRPPMFCVGCSHRGTFYTLKKLDTLVSGDIGCYTLGCLPPYSSLHTTFCMGTGIGNAFGFEKAIGDKLDNNIAAVIGDSTFIHGGIPSLIDIVYNRGVTTVIILDNNTTGMTGHQDHPGTGLTLRGEETYKLNFEELVKSIGVKFVRRVDPYNLNETEEVIKEALNYKGPSVVIAEHPCIMLRSEKAKSKMPSIVDEEACVECDVCLEFGCPALEETEEGPPVIDNLRCTGCGMCGQLCEFDAIRATVQ
jgi:indolepyruvate ferredoxin oxidoreductase alpha subunit